MGLRAFSFFILIFATTVAHAAPRAFVSGPAFNLVTAIGSRLDGNAVPGTAGVLIEPNLTWGLSDLTRVGVDAIFHQPFDTTYDLQISRILMLAEHRLYEGYNRWLHLRVSAASLDLNRWGEDGFHLRTGIGAEFTQRLRAGFEWQFRLTPYLQFSRYEFRTDGGVQPRYGFAEQFSIRYHAQFFHAEVRLSLEQAFARRWKNDYASLEQVYFDLSPNIAVGLAHEIASSLVDESTGRLANLRVFDGRESRISVFVEWKL